MKFVFNFEKKNKVNLGQVIGHNTRINEPASQLTQEAWFDKLGHHSIVKFDNSKLDFARSLAKRKDAVLAIEIIVQVGNQTDWREVPTAEHPWGKPRPGMHAKIKALVKGAREAAVAEFGAENIVSIDLHTDESTPHVHILCTPIHGRKLQAKHFVDGYKSSKDLRARVHAIVNKYAQCDYTPGAPGGAPHDPAKAAGGPLGLQPKPSMLDAAKSALSGSKTIEDLRKAAGLLNVQVQSLFSKIKRAELALAAALRDLKASKSESQELLKKQEICLRDEAAKLRLLNDKKFELIKAQLDESRSDCDTLAKRNNELLAARKLKLS